MLWRKVSGNGCFKKFINNDVFIAVTELLTSVLSICNDSELQAEQAEAFEQLGTLTSLKFIFIQVFCTQKSLKKRLPRRK
jgi:hypothetical protein